MDYDELSKRLRHFGKGLGAIPISDIIRQCMLDAATAIEDLQAESIMHHSAADNYYAELNEYREERNDALTELEQMTACVYYKPGGLCRHGGDDPANMCVLGPCPYVRSAEDVLADLARMTEERDAAIECLKNKCPFCRKYLTCQGRTINNDCWEFFGLKED